MSLSHALRAAALERARQSGQDTDGVILDSDGVIDLRELERWADRAVDLHTVKLPIIDEASIPAMLDLTSDRATIQLDPAPRPLDEATLRVTTFERDDATAAHADRCAHCGSSGQRDLIDRTAECEYFSCGDCGHMWRRLTDR